MARLGSGRLLSQKIRKKQCASDGSNTFLTQCTSLLHAISALTRLGFGGLFEPISLAEFEPKDEKDEKDVLRLLDSANRIRFGWMRENF